MNSYAWLYGMAASLGLNRFDMRLSVVIAAYNQQHNLGVCVDSVVKQINEDNDVEILIVDDCSTDSTARVIQELAGKYQNVKGFKTDTNSGPGVARNVGIENASYDWILFLDSDDLLAPLAISKLYQYVKLDESNLLNQSALDYVAYDFKFLSDESNESGSRTDLASLKQPKETLLEDYLSLKMDGSVIFTLMRKQFLDENGIRFFQGYHEDVDFMLKVYAKAQRYSILNDVIYIKDNRTGSIVNTISTKHIVGMFRAYAEMYKFMTDAGLTSANYQRSYLLGIIGVVATRIRQICLSENSADLYVCLHQQLEQLSRDTKVDFSLLKDEFETKYIKIFNYFVNAFDPKEPRSAEKVNQYLADIQPKSWSCYDLHNSLFFAPDQVRTCCKRFFRDGEMKGDVALLTPSEYAISDYNVTNIFDEKKKLFIEINKGESERCTGCDFLEFKNWENIKCEYISFEYHSVCNMKCVYCSDTYYGGERSRYDVHSLLKDLKNKKYLTDCKAIVWGGGEPTLGENFEIMIKQISTEFPNIQQRVISNATKISQSIIDGLKKNTVSLVTSIDAGSEEKFIEVRKNKQFERVLKNLKYYSEFGAENITIKYIFLDDNNSLHEIISFIKVISKFGLTCCNFQISYDFKKEIVSDHDLALITIMHSELVKLNVPLVILDDLLVSRVRKSNIDYIKVNSWLRLYNFEEYILDENSKREIVIWGAGKQTEILLGNERFNKLYNIAYIVDNTKSKIGSKINGYNIYSPEVLVNDNKSVLISAVQNSAVIKKKYIELGLNESNLIKNMIL
ncbi:glycosyltransferase [Vibrio vulnificus]|uniref:glycosyltransferase n=1 Tax=Vibrio vulnificus TaxID=672 RepID=UPI003ED9D425